MLLMEVDGAFILIQQLLPAERSFSLTCQTYSAFKYLPSRRLLDCSVIFAVTWDTDSSL